VGERLDVVLGTLDALRPAPYDLVLANLHGDVLLDIADQVMANTGPGATLVLSGIAWEWALPVREAYLSRGCTVSRERWLEAYVTMTLTRPSGCCGGPGG
jgi:ribosomal protein L11 methyltransferase